MPNLRRVDIEGAFRHFVSDEIGETRDSVLEPSSYSMKSKLVQSVEPLHRDCATAGVHLHLHDRAIAAEL